MGFRHGVHSGAVARTHAGRIGRERMDIVRIHEIKLRPRESTELLASRTEKRLRLPAGSIRELRIARESLDAREKPDIYKVYSVDVTDCTLPAEALLSEARRARVKASRIEVPETGASAFPYASFAHFAPPASGSFERPVIAGFGPCGIFAALVLARAGLRPLVLERGASMDERVAAVNAFWQTGRLDPRTNVQFGEGGAGSFSDGKLSTGTKDSLHGAILGSLVEAGAPEDIMYKQHPHIGTDILRRVVVNLRREILSLGADIRFLTRLEGLEIAGGRLRAVEISGSEGPESTERIETGALIMALGHSARDSFSMLLESGLLMEQKPFSMGVRIEHRQAAIDEAQFGAPHEELGLGPAEYKLSCRTSEGRGVYTFCMCPGGYVVASSSEPGMLCTNGMSLRARDAENANSALLVDVRPEDLGSAHPLAGVEFQRKYERLAFELGGGNYRAPAQTVGSFAGGLKGAPAVSPSYLPGTSEADIAKCLPGFVSEAIREALPLLGKKLRGFDDPGALMTAVESRSSSPVRIRRSEKGLALGADGKPIEGIYPCGEGAGYAGGIMSAAADGFRAALRLLEALGPEQSPRDRGSGGA